MKTPKYAMIRKIAQRAICLLTGLTLAFNCMYSVELLEMFRSPAVLTATAEGETTSYTPTNGVEVFSGNSFEFRNDDAGKTKFVDYCYYYSQNQGGTFCNSHKEDTLSIVFNELGTNFSFMGLGNATVPFKGRVKFVSVNSVSNITLPRALFTHVSTDAKLTDTSGNYITLEITKNSSVSSPLLADHVYPGTSAANWKIRAASGNTNEFAGVIGQLEEDADVTLEFQNASSAAVSNTASGDDIKDVGEFCGVMKTGSKLTVTDTTSARPAVTSANGNAGSLVGKMEGTASLTLNSGYPAFSGVSVTSNNGYAGGLVGEMSSDASITGLSSPLAVGGSVTGTTGAGGLYGHYVNSASTFDLKDYNITAAVYGQHCGGVFGVLDNSAASLTIQNTSNTETVNVSSGRGTAYDTTGYFGGIAGKYTTDDLENSLILDGFSITAASSDSFAAFGGVIGLVDSAAYIRANGITVNATGTAQRDSADYFGGLIGKTSTAKGVFVDLGNFTLSADSAGFKGGGIVGSFKNGVLRLSGTTDMSSAKSQKGGQLVGDNDNVLTYALGTGTNGTAYEDGWTFKRSNGSEVDDLGTWGEVVRIADIEDSDKGVLTLDTSDHTVTIKDAVAEMSTPAHLVKTALNIQLNQGSDYDCLKFTSGDNKRSDLLGTTLSLSDDISFAGTGITGFMRDGSASIGAFTGTFDGNSKTITLAVGEKYGKTSSGAVITSSTAGEGLGQIYAHPYNGLFAVIGNDTTGTGIVQSLIIAGTVNVRSTIDGMNIGGIAAASRGNTTLSGITASQTVNYGEPSSVQGSEAAGKNIGGLIGIANNSADNGTIAITGTNTISTTFNISDSFASWNALGAFIGKVTSPKFTINIAQGGSDTLTVSHTMTDNSFTAGGNSDGGGLIGYITSGTYSNRIINIDNLDFNNCTIVNKASSTAGGFLGYAWLDTDTTIKGLTVTNGTITNTTPDVGVMCYSATGRWKVNSLTITKMSLSGGAGSSLGMLVNKAYNGANGLYLDVLKSGYTLTDKSGDTGITLPNTLGVYDELAAYSASNVTKGVFDSTKGAGVISINMNEGRHDPDADPADGYDEARITETGTYQNQLTNASSTSLGSAKYANANSRYYYNLDVMNKSDAAQDIMLWSVKQYASANINSIFVCSSAPFNCGSETDVKLSSYSYYPVYNVSNLTLKNVDLEFGYNGIYTVEGNSTFNTDSYNRDPGAQNQHYLMQSGLFINSTEGSTLTLNDVKLSGDFLEDGTYQGVLISGTANGSISIDGLVLDGIKPNADSGYLLVKKVNRADAFKPSIQLSLKNISTSSKYTVNNATAQVTKSLFGDVYGPVIGINVEDVKLDARSTNGGLTALDSAYGTKQSIFTAATLFNSIKTTQTATMIYNYAWDKDWGDGTRNVTYGREVSESVEYEDKENKYYNDPRFTDPLDNNHTAEPEYDFSSWRPYVAQSYTTNQTQDTNGCYYRELKVNVPSTAYPSGCGTYNDPYIIDSGAKLAAIAALINRDSNTTELLSIQLPKTLHNGVAANTTGNRWCDSKSDHAVYTYDRGNTGATTYTSADSAAEWSVEDVRLYLANAYYSLASSTDSSGNIELPSSYLGLGGTDDSGKFAFRGVIVGNSVTILNNSQNPLVKVSNGCVLKDLTVKQNVDVNLQDQTKTGVTDAYFGYNSKCEYYGGLIGEIMGGDNIIDNSYVDFDPNTVYLKGTYGTLVPVGGYVGVIVYGGLIFKNIDARKTTLDQTKLDVVYKQVQAGVYTVTLGGSNASEGDTFTVADKTYTVASSDNKTPAEVAEKIKKLFSSDANYGVSRSGAVLTFTEKSGKYGTGQPVVSTTSGTTTIDAATTTSPLSGNLAANTDEALAAIYVNPLVGRVINGYAVNETGGNAKNASGAAVKQFSNSEDGYYHDDENTTRTGATLHTLKNGKKHYTIADLDPDLGKLDVTAVAAAGTDGNINVPNAQALFVLSLITQSCAGTATDAALGEYTNSLSYGTYDGNVYGMSHNANYSDVGTEDALVADDPSTANIDERNITDYQKIAVYDTANNTDGNSPIPYIVKKYTVGDTTVGTTTRIETSTEIVTEIVTEEVTHYSASQYTGTTITSGSKYLIRGHRNTGEYLTNERWDNTNKRNYVLKSTKYYTTADANLSLDETKIKNAIEVYFEKHPSNSTYCIYYTYKDSNNVEQRKYLTVSDVYYDKDHGITDTKKDRGNVDFSDDVMYFTVEYQTSNKGTGWTIKDSSSRYLNYSGDSTNFCAWTTVDEGTYFDLCEKTVTTTSIPHEVSRVVTHEVVIPEYTTTHNYPARCVTSTLGYYDINLTGSGTYQLPDSFRGLGCVGMYDSGSGKANKYCIKLDVFDGNECTIDLDIFLNKFDADNYFNKLHNNTDQILSATANHIAINGNTNTDNHGIGLFDSVIMKGSGSKFSDFELTGSVRTAIYNYLYDSRGECHDISGNNLFLSVGGVCGWARNNPVNIGFESIDLDDLSICGTNHFGGLLGYSGLQSPANVNDKTTYQIWIKECTADNISIKATAGSTVGDARQARCGMGAFVGKVQEGAVYIYGTEYEDDNPDPDANYSEVTIKNFELTSGDTNNYNMSAGGLVGFAGNGCKIYDMRLSSKSSAITIGGNKVNFAGGMVGGMQSSFSGGKTGVAVFKNCTVQNVNVNGNYAGGIYGGKWDSNWTTYSITMDNCHMIGTSGTHNTIFGNDSFGDSTDAAKPNNVAYAGGLIGKLYPFTNLDDNNQVTYNVLIKGCTVSNYDITAATTATSYAGGFIGYASSVNNSVTCYMLDSAVEDCKIGASGNYAGGVVGRVIQKDNNQILGYNIKLDTIETEAGDKMGSWIGHVPNDTDSKKTSIQLVGMAIYGKGYKNVGNDATLRTASFVFADYGEACGGTVPAGETERVYPTGISTFNNTSNVDMPKYPYVNINPQSSMGTDEIISGDGAVLMSTASETAEYSGKSAAKTMVLKLYEELTDTNNTRRYTTFKTFNDTNDAKINGDNKIDYYMKRTKTDDGDRISNYYYEKGYDSAAYDNFACVVIANNTTAETTALINRYAQLVTNTTTDYAGTDAGNDYFDIVVSPCILRGGKFEIDDDTLETGLEYSNGQFSMTSHADSLSSEDTFTLVDIQFKDPLHKENVAYHLYIPVYTIKEIEVGFSAAVMSGTNPLSKSLTDPYLIKLAKTNTDTHVDNLNTWYTTLIRYTYDHDDLEALLDSGNLNWSHNKYFYIDKTGHNATSMLPADTYMILVDPNGDHDKKYQALLDTTNFAREGVTSTTGRITFDLTKFTDSSSDPFSVSTFNELIAKKIVASDTGGKFDLYSGTPDYTGTDHYVYTKSADGTKTYYKYVGTGGAYDLTLSNDDIYEDYYISMYVPTPATGNYFYGYYIRTPDKFNAPTYASGTNNAVTKSAKVNCTYVDASHTNDDTQGRQVYLGSVFDQDTELSVIPDDLEITSGNHIMNIYAKTTISPLNANAITILRSVDADVYHSFNVYLDRKDENGVLSNKIFGLNDAANVSQSNRRIQAWYSVGTEIPKGDEAVMTGFSSIPTSGIELNDNYINVLTSDIGSNIQTDSNVVIYSRIRLNFDTSYLEKEFPPKVAKDTGVSVRAASNISYEQTKRAFSNMTKSLEEPTATKHIYYRQSVNTATLKYYSKNDKLDSYDTDGAPSENYSRLGVSGKYSMNGYMPVDTTAQYNVQNIGGALEEADTLQLTLSLQKKTDLPTSGGTYTSAKYQDVTSIRDYWGAVARDGTTHEVAPNDRGAPVTVANTTNLYVKCGNYDAIVPITEDSASFTLEIPKSYLTVDEDGYIYADIEFNVKTKEEFKEYANYRVNITAKLLDGSSDIQGSYAESNLIYTNAKVNHDFLNLN